MVPTPYICYLFSGDFFHAGPRFSRRPDFSGLAAARKRPSRLFPRRAFRAPGHQAGPGGRAMGCVWVFSLAAAP